MGWITATTRRLLNYSYREGNFETLLARIQAASAMPGQKQKKAGRGAHSTIYFWPAFINVCWPA